MGKTAILFTGKIYPETFDAFIDQTDDIEYKVASIWENENPEYIQTLIDNNFIVVKSDVKQQELFVPQFIPIVNGLKWIKENDFDYVLRSRFDVLSTDYNKYIEIIEKLYPNKITALAGIDSGNIYFVQIMEYGSTNDMCRFYVLQDINDGRYPEGFLTEQYLNKINLTRDDIKSIFNFSLDACIENNIEFIWYRPSHWKTSLRTIPYMRVIKEYCRDPYIWTESQTLSLP
jgi:hypothetical protein